MTSLTLAISTALNHVCDALDHADTDRCSSLASLRKAQLVLVAARRMSARVVPADVVTAIERTAEDFTRLIESNEERIAALSAREAKEAQS